MISFEDLLESISYKNQKLLSNKSPKEKTALHNNMRVLNKMGKAADNTNAKLASYYQLFDDAERQVYNEAGKFSTAAEAFKKFEQLYDKDPDAYGDLSVIKFEGKTVYSITQRNGKFYKSKIG